MYKKYMKHIVSLLLALCLVVTAVLGNVGGAGLLQADAAETGTELTPVTFSDFDELKVDGSYTNIWIYKGGFTWVDKCFNGYITLDSVASVPYIVFGSTTRWDGLQFIFTNDGKMMQISDAQIGSPSHTVNVTAEQAGLKTGSFEKEEFLLTFSLKTTDTDDSGNTTALELQVLVNNNSVGTIQVTNVYVDHLVGTIATHNTSLNIRSYTPSTEPEVPDEPEVVAEPRKLTFADFGLEDKTYEDVIYANALNTVDSSKVSSLTMADSEISGYMKFDDADRSVTTGACWVIGHTGLDGLQVQFYPYDTNSDRIYIITSKLTDTNAEDFLYVLEDGLFDDTFKISLSFETVDSDGDNAKDDLALRLYINDKLCTAHAPTITNNNLSTGETVGEYYICDYKADAFRPYISMRNMSTTVETMYKSVTLRSCELPYKNTSTFVDYGISDGLYDTGIKSGTSPFALEYTKLSGNVTVGTQSSSDYCLINYGGTTTSENTAWPGPEMGGLQIQFEGGGNFHILAGTRLGTSYLNATGSNMSTYRNVITNGTPFDISFNTIPWDWDGDGKATDGKIEIRIDDALLQNKYIIIESMFETPENLVNRFSFITGGHTGTKATFDVKSQAQDVSRLRKLELADFGLANGDCIEQAHKSTGPASLLNTMMEVNLSVEASTSGSWIHYAVPLGKANEAWYGTSFRISGNTISVVDADAGEELGTIQASEIERDSFFGEAFKLGLSVEKIDFQGDGNNDDVRLGVWMEGRLVRNYYYVDKANELGTGMSVLSYVSEAEMYQNTVTVTDITETNNTFTTTLGLDDVNASGVAAGVYGYSANPEATTLLTPNTAVKDGNLDNAIFSTNVRFSKEYAKLIYGCPTETSKGWYGLWIGSDGNSKETFSVHYAGWLDLLTEYADEHSGTVPVPTTIHAGVAGVQLFDNTYKLSISTRYADSDGDDVFDDLEVGIWFNDVLYNNTYYYIDKADLSSELKPNIGVHVDSSAVVAHDNGSIVLGNYTQNTPTDVTYCADEFDYFVYGDTVTVAGNEQGTSWSTSKPDTYAIEYTNTTTMGTSTFKENVLVYKTNDVTADGVVNVVDLIALKKLAAGQRSDTTPAGKEAVGYAEDSAWYTPEVQKAMYDKLLADVSTIQAKVMSDVILGETGSNTYITSLGSTQEGTSVIGISDVADAANRTYTTDMDVFDGSGLDFVLDFDTDREIKVLQITDTQIIDAAQRRTENRLSESEKVAWDPEQMDNALFDELKALVEKETPDLIVMTGDNVYGEFDDEGTSLKKLIEVMDGFKIPWAPIFGNHDNESAYGVAEQCRMFVEDSTYCLFNRRNEIGGNGNYAIGISVQGKLQRTIFMMDSNGCSNLEGVANQADKDAVTTSMVFHDEQMAWYQTVAAKVNAKAGEKIPSFLCVHVPLAEMTTALVETGYQAKADATVNAMNISHNYTIGNIVEDGSAWTYAKDTNNNFGFKEARTVGSAAMSEYILPYLKAAGTDGTFFGHQHVNALSVEWEGIRFTYGLKTGRYDESPNQTGGTVITLKGSEFDVNHAIINNLDAE